MPDFSADFSFGWLSSFTDVPSVEPASGFPPLTDFGASDGASALSTCRFLLLEDFDLPDDALTSSAFGFFPLADFDVP